jgi:hypothetical protein
MRVTGCSLDCFSVYRDTVMSGVDNYSSGFSSYLYLKLFEIDGGYFELYPLMEYLVVVLRI